ncbi:olfactory receptor 14A2-like [Python bivittatus]|uniref:Olfactory receptor n=1 Tax=Python bivittatus TaxID=176946 RepID=A0A9F5J5L2_PYTBI|nr:olfactory receptor 14A2-like [Python bivittatus]XP_025033162.1 olfactory receptor 14A2-like [Python bivittatus]
MDNQTGVRYFLLLEISETQQLQLLHFFLFFVLYLAITTANLLIICAVVFHQQLQRPMYFFLMNLAVQDLGSVSVIVPKSMINSLTNSRHISYFGCVAQVFLFVSFLGSNVSILTVMAYDRYVAICNPLQYEMVMNWKACAEIIILVWVTSLLYGMLHTTGTFSVFFCSNVVNQFFCEVPQLLKLSCSGFNLVEVGVLVASVIAGLGCVAFIIVSYAMIFKAVLRIPSEQGRQKALSTCIPHLTVVLMVLITGCFAYLRPPSNTPSYLDFGLTVLYSLLPPLFNPIIYSMRNQNIRFVLSKLWRF